MARERSRKSTVSPPVALIIEPSLVDFGEVAVDSEAFQEVRVTNEGPGSIPVEAPFIEPGGSPGFEVVGNDCGRDLEEGESCGVVLAFRPADTGPHLAALALGDGHQISIRGVGVGSGKNPGLQPEPSFVDFGKVEVGSAAAREVRFTNPGPGSIGVEGPIIERGISTDFHIDDSDCRNDIAADASCVVAVAFRPINEGPHSAVLALGGGARVELHGTGIGISADLVVTYSPSRETVAVGQILTYVITVHNHGPFPAHNTTVSTALPNDTTLRVPPSQDSCTFLRCDLGTLNSGATVIVRFEVEVSTAAAEGTVLTSTATVDSDVSDPNQANNTASAHTRVQSPNGLSGLIDIDRETIEFGDAPGTEQKLLLTNVGGVEVTIRGHSVPDPFKAVGCVGTTLAPAESCEITVMFPASGGVWSEVLEVSHDGVGDPVLLQQFDTRAQLAKGHPVNG